MIIDIYIILRSRLWEIGYLEVDEEDDDAKVDEGVRCRDEVGLLVQYEDDGGHEAGLGGAANNNTQLSLTVMSFRHSNFNKLSEQLKFCAIQIMY